jgi:hypothetical protein
VSSAAPDTAALDPAAAMDQLARSRSPLLIGVRHHSPAVAAAIPALLASAQPELVMVELPGEMQEWMPWLAHAELQAPIALAAVRKSGGGLAFYPFADFSPELAAIRWANQNGVAIEAFDLPYGSPAWGDDPRAATSLAPRGTTDTVASRLLGAVGVRDHDELWDRLVEVRAPQSSPEAVRRAALGVGWALRMAALMDGEIPTLDQEREAWMRARLEAHAGKRVAVVAGAFHAPALMQDAERSEPVAASKKPAAVVTSLIPYSFDLLDSRSGYPAGIRDPEWQQAVWQCGFSAPQIEEELTAFAVRVGEGIRRQGHAAGVPDTREVVRIALDLAHLRRLPAPGRRELVEGLQGALAQGEPLGRGRAVARAMEATLVGRRRGRLAPGTPRSGLGPYVETLLRELALPGPDSMNAEPVDIRLDPLRSGLDRRRHVTIHRLLACAVPYAVPLDAADRDVDIHTLTTRWNLRWQPATAALIDLAGIRGVTLEQAADGSLRAREAEAEREDDGVTAALRLRLLSAATECGLESLAAEWLRDLGDAFLRDAGLAELMAAIDLSERILRGHIPGYRPDESTARWMEARLGPDLLAAAVRQLEALAGSDRLEDARALIALVGRLDAQPATGGGDTRLGFALHRLATEGSPLMQGAASAVRALTGRDEVVAFGGVLGSWVDAAADARAQSALAARLKGVLVVAAPFLESAAPALDELAARLRALDDEPFLRRLPALRDAFDVLSPASRRRLLAVVGDRWQIGQDLDLQLEHDPRLLARWADADLYGRQAVNASLPGVL